MSDGGRMKVAAGGGNVEMLGMHMGGGWVDEVVNGVLAMTLVLVCMCLESAITSTIVQPPTLLPTPPPSHLLNQSKSAANGMGQSLGWSYVNRIASIHSKTAAFSPGETAKARTTEKAARDA